MSVLEVEERARLALLLDSIKRTLEAEIESMHPKLFLDGVDTGIKDALIGLECTLKWLIDLKCYETLQE